MSVTAKLAAQAAFWNEQHPVGSTVRIEMPEHWGRPTLVFEALVAGPAHVAPSGKGQALFARFIFGAVSREAKLVPLSRVHDVEKVRAAG